MGLIAAFLLIEVAADWLRDRDDGPAPTQVAALSIATISPPPITAPTVDSFYTCPTPCAADGSNSQRQFPEGTTEIFVRWSYNEIAPGVAFDRSWTNNNVLYVQYLCRWDQASNGVAEIRLWAPNNDPLPSGQWTMKIAVDQTQLLEESIEIAGNVGPIRLSDPNRSACFD